MQKHIVTIIHLILIAILLVAGLLLLVDMHHVSQRCTNQEIFSGQEEQEVIPQGSKPNSGKTAKSMREQAVMEMTKALDGMTADEAYDWFQGILEEDIRNWRNPSGKSLDDSVEWARELGDELERLAAFDYIDIDDMMMRAEDPDYKTRNMVVIPGSKRTTIDDLRGYLAELDMSSFDEKAKAGIMDFNGKLDGLLAKMENGADIREEDGELALELLREFNETLKKELLKQHWGEDYVILGEMTSQSVPEPVFYYQKRADRERALGDSFIGTMSGNQWLYPLKQQGQE